MFREKQAHTFRVSWLRLYATMAFLFLLVTAGLLAVLPLITGRVIGALPLPAIFGGLMTELIFSFVYAVCFPTRLTPRGLHGFNFWGLPRRVAWDDISAATPSRFLGLPWLVVRSRQTRNVLNALWLPLFYADNPAFRETLALYAPPSSPVQTLRP